MEEVKGFNYHKTAKRFVANYKDGKWDNGKLTSSAEIRINECACVFQYAQTCFEGLKAYRTEDGHIVCFRPNLNEERFKASCERMMIPQLPEGMFLKAVKKVVKANEEFIPSAESGGSLYLRPFSFGTDPVIAVHPASEYQFRLFGTPVGSYFAGGVSPLHLRVSDFDRAAPHGTGHIKAGLNYAMSLYAISDAHAKGYDENLFLDAATRTYIEETGGANVLFVDKNGKLVTPLSDTILPSITRRSLMYVAEHYLKMKVETRKITADELADFKECGLCGTAAVISPVGSIDDHGKLYTFNMDDYDNTVMGKLYHTLLDIQHGKIKAPRGWIVKIK